MRYRNQTKSNIENQRNKETKRIKRKYDDESFELSKMAYVESYGGLDQELRGICGFQNTRVPGSQKKVHTKSLSRRKLVFWFLSTLNSGARTFFW